MLIAYKMESIYKKKDKKEFIERLFLYKWI